MVILAYGGSKSEVNNPSGDVARGGGFYFSQELLSFYGEYGDLGGANKFEYFQSGPTTFIEIQTGGKGGDAGNSANTGAKGEYLVRNVSNSTTIYNLRTGGSKIPGGGAGGSTPGIGVNTSEGGGGMVIIHY